MTYIKTNLRFTVGDPVYYSGAWGQEPPIATVITGRGVKNGRVVYDNAHGHWGYVDQYVYREPAPLAFPTMAEQALEEFRSATKTVSLAAIAKRRGADQVHHWDHIEYVFDDDTSIQTRGRGRSHKIEVLLP